VATRFGFAAGNQTSPLLTQYYDNFRVAVSSNTTNTTSVPTLSQWAMMALVGLLALSALAKMQRKQ
jgi:hypothetical protein